MPTTPLAIALTRQAASCADLGSPFMARLCTLLAARLAPTAPLTRRLFDWPGDISSNGASVPLRLAGALHALVLQGHPGLGAVYPPNEAPDAALWAAVEAALEQQAAFIDAFIDSPPQTNEIRRSAVLIAAGHALAERFGLPLILSELGASAGLNLIWDRYALDTGAMQLGPAEPVLTLRPEWRGVAPVAGPLRVAKTEAGRAGVDLAPIALDDPAQRLRLLAYLWPDQPHRRALTEAAIAAHPPRPAQGDAVDWLAPRLEAPFWPRPGHLQLIWSTIAWQYFPAERQQTGTRLIEAAGARASAEAPLAWLSYEADGQAPGAALTLRLWPGDLTFDLGRADFHGRWVDWRGL